MLQTHNLIKELKKSSSFMLAVFILSVFAGVILSIIVKQWVLSNINIVKQTQAKEETNRLNLLLDKYNK